MTRYHSEGVGRMAARQWLVTGVAVSVVVLAGCGGGGGEAPSLALSGVQVTPTALPVTGGAVQLAVTVGAAGGATVARVWATVTSGATVDCDLTATGAGRYAGSYTIPANGSLEARDYTVQLRARDGAGEEYGAAAVHVTVPANGPPTVTGAILSPATLRFTGGQVSIQAQVTDDESVAGVEAEVTGPSGTSTVSLVLGGGVYSGSYAAPANAGPGESAYTVAIRATDNRGYTCINATTPTGFMVSPPPSPPPLP